MILELRDLDEFPAQVTLASREGEFAPVREDVKSVGPVTVSLTIQKSGDEFFCQGTVTAALRLECARCLVAFEYDVEGHAGFIATTEQLREQYRAEAVDDEEYVTFIAGEMRVDVTDLMREALLLELPMKPLCRDACKGLCSRCGANLNEKPCECETKSIDPRWEGLKVLLKRAPEKGNE